MQNINLKLDDAPLIIAALLPQSDIEITWLKQTSLSEISKLPIGIKAEVEKKLEWMLRQYHALQKQDDLRPVAPHVLPFLAKANLQISANKTELVNAIEPLSAIPLKYTHQLASSLSESLGVKRSNQSSISDDSVGAIVSDRKRIRLVQANPLNEFDLILPSVYTHSTQTWHDTSDSLSEYSFDKKEKLLRASLKFHNQHNLTYWFELVVEPQIMREIQNSISPPSLLLQSPTPAHGYSIPKVQDGGMIERCFDLSYELFSQLQSSLPSAAPLVCLNGHRQRFAMELDFQCLNRIYDRSVKLSKPALNVIKFIRKEISLKHPTVNDWFENKEE